jgi:ABC-type uncharacterized transport system involved in gliding motility auxiliary subunit
VPALRVDEEDDVVSHVIVFGGEDIFNPRVLAMQNANNADFFINITNEISGRDGFVPNLIQKSFTVPSFEITSEQADTLGFVFIFALPLAIITAGVVVWVRRIRK